VSRTGRGAGNSQALMAGVWPVLHNVRRAQSSSREICPGPSSIWCSSPALGASGPTTNGTRVRRIRSHDQRHTCASLPFAQGVSPPCADGRAGSLSAFDHHGFVLQCDAECLARCGRRDGSGAEEKSMIGGLWWWTIASALPSKLV
jgi:hypothetical protein